MKRYRDYSSEFLAKTQCIFKPKSNKNQNLDAWPWKLMHFFSCLNLCTESQWWIFSHKNKFHFPFLFFKLLFFSPKLYVHFFRLLLSKLGQLKDFERKFNKFLGYKLKKMKKVKFWYPIFKFFPPGLHIRHLPSSIYPSPGLHIRDLPSSIYPSPGLHIRHLPSSIYPSPGLHIRHLPSSIYPSPGLHIRERSFPKKR